MPTVTSPGACAGVSDPGLQKLLGSLDQLESKADGTKSDLLFLRELLESQEFQNLLELHEKVGTPEAKDTPTMYETTLDLINEVEAMLYEDDSFPEAEELYTILTNTHIRALLNAHDQIALKDFAPTLSEVPYAVDEDEGSVKIVRLVKGPEEPLGATIHMDEETGVIKIARVMLGGAADRSGLIQSGDEVHVVNGIKVKGKSPTEVVQILNSGTGPITMKLVPGVLDFNNVKECRMRVRTLFDYHPVEDQYIPCKEAGLAFKRGDILHIVCQDDANWWQARKEGDKSLRAGLIPGKLLQERKEIIRTAAHGEPIKGFTKAAKFSPKLTKKNRRIKKLSHLTTNDEADGGEILTYEEVETYLPCRNNGVRTIIILGASGVGCTVLQNKLIEANPERYERLSICTSCPKKTSDSDGECYLHVSKQDMEKAIQNKTYFEYWEHKGHMYGLSLDAVKAIIREQKVPVITCSQPQGIKQLRCAEIKPYLIYIKPTALFQLKATRQQKHIKHIRSYSDDELQEMLQMADLIDANYGHYVDVTIVNEHLDIAERELLNATKRLLDEPQWIPVTWT